MDKMLRSTIQKVMAGVLSAALVIGSVPAGAWALDVDARLDAPTDHAEQIAPSVVNEGQQSGESPVLPSDQSDEEVSSASDRSGEGASQSLDDEGASQSLDEVPTATENPLSPESDEQSASQELATDDTAQSPQEPVAAPEHPVEEPTLAPQASVTITYVPANPIEIVLGSVAWDEWDSCYLYQYIPRDGDMLKVKRGTTTETFTYDEGKYRWKGSDGYAWMEVQLYVRLSEAQNKLGAHEMNVDYFKDSSLEARGKVSFSLIESPLASIAYKPAHTITLVRGTDSSSYYEYDESTKTGHTYHHYFFPRGERLMGDALTLAYEDGTAKTYVYQAFKNPTYGYDELAYVNADDPSDVIALDDIEIYADQSYAHKWGAGTHYFTLNYLGKTTQVPVRVKAPSVTQVAYAHSPRFAYSTVQAIAYTKKLGIYDKSYASKVTKYQIIFPAPEPCEGDVLKVTTKAGTTSYVFRAAQEGFVSKSDASNVIPRRDITISPLTVQPGVTKATFTGSYQGVEFAIPFNVTKATQKVSATNKYVVAGKKAKVNARSTGFAETKFVYKSSNTKVATVNSQGVITGRKNGWAKITIVARSTVAYKASAAKVIKVKVGRANPLTVTAPKKLATKRGARLAPLRVSRARGTVSFANVSTHAYAKKIRVNAKTGKMYIPKGLKKGTYTLKVRVRAAGKGAYIRGTKTVAIRVTVR